MARFQKDKPISLANQYLSIKQKYGNIDKDNTWYRRNELKVRLLIKPTPDSEEYTIDIKYKLGSVPKVFLIFPGLKTFNGRKPHHLYGEENGYPRLCLYYPDYHEWTKYQYISDTIIPWISTWLFAYEFWQITGEWHFSEINFSEVNNKK